MLDIVFGWQGLDSLTNTLIDKIDKAVIIFPHTSVYDIITFIPYVYQKCFRNRLFVMARKSAVNNIIGNMYYSLFFNPVVIKESKQGKILKCNNVVDSVVNQLKNKDRFLLFISPEGSRDKKPWKSGLYPELEMLWRAGQNDEGDDAKMCPSLGNGWNEELTTLHKAKLDLANVKTGRSGGGMSSLFGL